MMYHKQFQISQPCAPGLCGDLCSWIHEGIQHDGRCFAGWGLTALSMTRMTSLTWILFVDFVTNIAFALSTNSHLRKETDRIGSHPAWVWFWIIHILRSSLAHAQTKYHVAQFGPWIQENCETQHNW
jgi:hypothetical protein